MGGPTLGAETRHPCPPIRHKNDGRRTSRKTDCGVPRANYSATRPVGPPLGQNTRHPCPPIRLKNDGSRTSRKTDCGGPPGRRPRHAQGLPGRTPAGRVPPHGYGALARTADRRADRMGTDAHGRHRRKPTTIRGGRPGKVGAGRPNTSAGMRIVDPPMCGYEERFISGPMGLAQDLRVNNRTKTC